MKATVAQRLSDSLLMIGDCYDRKSKALPFSQRDMNRALRYTDEALQRLYTNGTESESLILVPCLESLYVLMEEKDDVKIAALAHAIHRVPLVFNGKAKWNRAFKKTYLRPFCEQYGEESLEKVLDVTLPEDFVPQKEKKGYYRYDDVNLISFGAYVLIRLLVPIVAVLATGVAMLYLALTPYTEADRGERFEITVERYEYDNTLTIYCPELEYALEITGFQQHSTEPDKLIDLCESGARLVVYAEFKHPVKYHPYYKVIHLEDAAGNVYRSWEQTNSFAYIFYLVLAPIFAVSLLYGAVVLTLMLYIKEHPQKFKSKPRLLKFCFHGYSLSTKKNV